MAVITVQPDVNARGVLPGAQFMDAFSTVIDDATLNARQTAERMFARQPRWIAVLMAMRDRIVTPFGLKTEKMARIATDRVGMFPVISETPQRIVAGLDDRHLDFRVIVDVAPSGSQQRVTTTTIVLTHNLLGRAYLAIIMPFHRLVVRAMLKQVAG